MAADGPNLAGPSGKVVVSIRSEAEVAGEHVCLADLADLQGADEALRQQLAALDVEELPPLGQDLLIPKAQIHYRLRIAGVPPERFTIQGADPVRVRRAGNQLVARDFERAARQLVLHHVPWPAAEVGIRLERAIQLPQLELDPADRVRLQADLPTPSTRVAGPVQINVALHVNDELRGVVPVYLNVRPYQEVVVAAYRLEPGALLNQENVRPDRRAVDGEKYLTYPETLTGRRARRALLPGQVITAADVELAVPANPVLVKPQEQVKIVARIGSLKVTALGEALQEGRAGQLIRVRNFDSKKIIQGKVIDRSTVEVGF